MKWVRLESRDPFFFKFWGHIIYLEQVKLGISNLVCRVQTDIKG